MKSTKHKTLTRSISTSGVKKRSEKCVNRCNFSRSRLVWLTSTRERVMRMPTPMPKACTRNFDRIDRSRFEGEPLEDTWLNLEIGASSSKLIARRMVRRGRLVSGETIDCLAQVSFVIPRGEWCGVALADELDADDPRHLRPPVDPADDVVLRRPVSPSMLRKLAARSSRIKVLGAGTMHQLDGLIEGGIFIRCEKGEHAYANGS